MHSTVVAFRLHCGRSDFYVELNQRLWEYSGRVAFMAFLVSVLWHSIGTYMYPDVDPSIVTLFNFSCFSFAAFISCYAEKRSAINSDIISFQNLCQSSSTFGGATSINAQLQVGAKRENIAFNLYALSARRQT